MLCAAKGTLRIFTGGETGAQGVIRLFQGVKEAVVADTDDASDVPVLAERAMAVERGADFDPDIPVVDVSVCVRVVGGNKRG